AALIDHDLLAGDEVDPRVSLIDGAVEQDDRVLAVAADRDRQLGQLEPLLPLWPLHEDREHRTMVTAAGRRATARGFRFRGDNLAAPVRDGARGPHRACRLWPPRLREPRRRRRAYRYALATPGIRPAQARQRQHDNGRRHVRDPIHAHSTIIACFDFNSTT